MPVSVWRALAKAHEVRNVAEYEGHFDADANLLQSLIEATELVHEALEFCVFGDVPRYTALG
jgi:hypothetical protein